MSHRVEKVASTLRQAIQQVLARGLHDPRVAGLITITSVQVTHDLKNATVMVSVLPEEKQQTTYHGLRDAARHIRHEVGELVAMRSVPQLTFKLDKALKKEAQALAAIARISEERADKPATDDPAKPLHPRPEPNEEGAA
ncbi:MAG: 30S ribosome-binding factor RbfA [Phycisphaerales bacterium]